MQYRPLGRTGIEVSAICLGTMTFGAQNSEADAHSQLDLAIERGINFIDTAELYPSPASVETQGATERYIGSWLAARGRRDDIVLASKVVGPGEFVAHIRGGPKLDAAHIERAVEDSLRRLGTDYLDLYQVHWPARATNYFGQLGFDLGEDRDNTPVIDTLRALGRLVDSGKVRHIGLSNETAWGAMHYLQLAEREGLPRIASVQNPYCLLNRGYEVGLAEISYREDVGLLAYSPLGFGVLTGKYLDGARPQGARISRWSDYYHRYSGELAQQATRKYVALAAEHGLSPAQMALAFVNGRFFVTSNIIGATSLQQLEENIASIDVALSEALLQGIEAIHIQHPNPCP